MPVLVLLPVSYCDKDGESLISDWLRNRNTVELLGIWESVYSPAFNYGEFATIKSQAGSLDRLEKEPSK
jgi:hypothetical protein